MLKQRILTAMVLLAVAIVFLFVLPLSWFPVLVLSIYGLMAWEWAGLTQLTEPRQRLIYLGLSVFVFVLPMVDVLQLTHTLVWQIYTFMLTLAVLIAVRLFARQGEWPAGWSTLALGFGVLWLSNFAWSVLSLVEALGVGWLLYAMSLVWVTDTGAYFSGRAFGKTKLALKVSPGKTWEGVVGGVSLAVLLSVFVAWQTDMPWLSMMVLALIVSFLSIYGDLFESALKRQVGVKDSSNMLPGHGGWLDRFDALLLAIPLFWLLWQGMMLS
ncbi:MAG: phosphatidate cytidylyltransferase [Aquaspirillum sp.]